MAGEKFDFKKFLFTRIPTSGEWWGKFMDLAWKLFLIWAIAVFIVIPIKNRFFEPKRANVETISGGNVDLSTSKKIKAGVNILNFGGA